MFERFYTYPPHGCEHPWILRNIKQKPIDCVHEIVDIGIYDLLKTEGHKHTEEKLNLWSKLNTDGWKVVPDCPDIKGEFNQHVGFDNVEYSQELLLKYFDPRDDSQLPVIQSNYEDLRSFKDYIKWFKCNYGEHNKIAIGSICKSDNNKKAIKMLKIARREFNNSWIHAFGLRFKQFIKARHLINSFDSTSWTFPRTQGHSCKNQEERIEYFYDYIKRINEVMTPYNQNQLKLVMCYGRR